MKILCYEIPLARTYLCDAYPYSIMKAHGEEYLEWFYSNHIMLSCSKRIGHNLKVQMALKFYDMLGYKSPFVEVQTIFRSLLEQIGQNIHLFLQKAIDSNCYIDIGLDEYYIPARHTYKSIHNLHTNLVYGYDEEARKYYLLGYNSNGDYGSSVVSFDEFEQAYIAAKKYIIDMEWMDKIFLLSYKNNVYKFNKKLVCLSLQDYLNSRNRCLEYSREYNSTNSEEVYGVAIYEEVIEYINTLCSSDINIDFRIFRMIMEHKQIMLERMKFMQNKYVFSDKIISDYEDIVKKTKIIFGNVMMYAYKKDNKYLRTVEKLLVEIKQDETIILQTFLGIIEKL